MRTHKNMFSAIELVESIDPRITGYYAELHTDTIDTARLTWRDCGNGPEVEQPNVHGPFATEADADNWLADYADDLDEA